jgi:phage terminase large subunit
LIPASWISLGLDITRYSKGQLEILEAIPRAIAENKPIVVPSGNAQGKDFLSARIALWFLYNYSPSKVIITAPTDRQVKDIVWSEIETAWNNAHVEMPGRILTCKIDVMPNWFMIGFTTKESGGMIGKAQGFHSPNVCVIASEAQAIDDKINVQLDSLLNAEVNLYIMIGNPLRTTGFFARAIDNTTDNIVINLDALDSPNYRNKRNVIPGMASYEWIEKKRKEWDPEGKGDHPLWLSRVRGIKPRSSIDTLFAEDLIKQMISREPRQLARKICVSCDPAGMGDDEQVIYGAVSGRIVGTDIKPQSRAPESCSLILQMVRNIGANHVTIDADGLGGPICDFVDRLKPRGVTLQAVHANGKAEDEQYENLKAEMWFYAKQEAEAGREQIPEDEYLKQELMEMKYFINLKGKMQIESKDDLKERLGRSPGRADAWVLNVWGRKASAVVHKKDSWRDQDGSMREVSQGAVSAMAA